MRADVPAACGYLVVALGFLGVAALFLKYRKRLIDWDQSLYTRRGWQRLKPKFVSVIGVWWGMVFFVFGAGLFFWAAASKL